MLKLTGIGLRKQHYQDFLCSQPPFAWLEVHSENYFGEGPQLGTLEKIRENYPISLHGVSLSLGSSDELNWQHLKKLRDLILRLEPCLISDHLCWSSFNGQYFHDLFPLPHTQEVIQHTVGRIQQIQEYLKKPLLIENISRYVQFNESLLSEEVFLTEIATRAGCGILLDINNLYINACNLGFNAEKYIQTIPKRLVKEIHLAGHSALNINDQDVLIDSHDKCIAPAVWQLYQKAIREFGVIPTIIEWDTDLPAIETLYHEAEKAELILRKAYVTNKSAS